jgi:DNA-binding ferritin-like protein
MEELASLLLQSRTQTHSFHLGVRGVGAHSAHVALGEYYDSIGGLIDGLVEVYQGKEGLIQLSGIGVLDKNNDIKNIIKYFETLCGMVAKLRQNPKLQDSWIQNDIDTVVSLLYKTKYKLVNHQ